MIDKTPLNVAGLPESEDMPFIEIDLGAEDATPTVVENADGSVDVIITPEPEVVEEDFYANLAESMDERSLNLIAGDLLQAFDEDCQSRQEWLDTYLDGIKLLGLKIEERTEPFPNACGIFNPMLAEAAVKFQAELMQETMPASGPVKTELLGKETDEALAAAARVKEDMNYRITVKMPEYRMEHEKLGWALSITGSAFKKVYYDEGLGREVAIFIPAEDLVVPYGTSTLEAAERITHVMRKNKAELRRLQVNGFYRDVDLGDPVPIRDEAEEKKAKESGYDLNNDDRYQLLEIDCYMELPGTEDKYDFPMPYVITIDRGTHKVLGIRRNWIESDPNALRRKHYVHYPYVPGFGFYGYGLVHLVGGHARTATQLTRQLVDAGTLANLPGGLKAKSARIKNGEGPIGPGEWRDVDVTSQTIKDSFMPLPYKEPSQTLLALLQAVVDDGKRFANTSDMQVSDMSAQAPVGTTLALLERQLKSLSAVQARVHYAMREEFAILKGLIRDNLTDDYEYDPVTGERAAKASDYDMVNVLPVSDPNASTLSQKIVQIQAGVQLSQQLQPGVVDQKELARQAFETIGLKHVDKLVPMPQDKMKKPIDPVSENMNLLVGKPVKAFLHQDHQAHIAVHMAAIQDPKIQALMQGNPAAQGIMAAAMAHITEHLSMEYRKQIEAMMGMPLPVENEEGEIEIDPQIEVMVSQRAAQAAQQLLQKNTAEAQQQQAQQQAQDPLIQLQQQELALKDKEIMRKEADSQRDFTIAQQKLALENQRLANDGLKAARKDQITVGVKMADLQQKALEAEKGRVHQAQESDKGHLMNALNKQKVDNESSGTSGSRNKNRNK